MNKAEQKLHAGAFQVLRTSYAAGREWGLPLCCIIFWLVVYFPWLHLHGGPPTIYAEAVSRTHLDGDRGIPCPIHLFWRWLQSKRRRIYVQRISHDYYIHWQLPPKQSYE